MRIVMPNDVVGKRTEVAQREIYRVRESDKLPGHIEFELSRLLEK